MRLNNQVHSVALDREEVIELAWQKQCINLSIKIVPEG
jgi:hypothetical protein